MTDYSSAISSVEQSNAQAAQSLTSETSPDDAARAFQLSQSTGVPAEHIGNDLDGFEEQHKKALAQGIIADNGYIQDFVNAHPLHGPLISDDLGNLDALSRSYRKLVEMNPQQNFGKGFQEGFGLEGFGHWQQNVSPEWTQLSQKYPLSSQLWTALGFPFEAGGRLARGIVVGTHHAVQGLLGDKAAADIAGLVEQELMKPEVKAHIYPGKTEFEYPAEGEVLPPKAGRGLPGPEGPPTIDLSPVREAIEDLRPWLEAGEEPPAGISEIADKAKEESAKLDQDVIKQALDDASSTALKERSPEKFAEFLDGHPDGTISIEKEIIAKDPGAFDWIPNLEVEMDRPLSKVEVSAKDFLTNFDKDLWPEVKDYVSRGGPSANEAKEIIAYHGSPHDFDRFDSSRIGTGEGAQNYGRGLYLAEEPKVAEYYAVGRQTGGTVTVNIPDNPFSGTEILDVAPPHMYQVNIKADREHFLDWDKPLSQQSDHVRNALKGVVDERNPGSDVHEALVNMHGSDQAATEALRKAGIPGIRYLDQGSRGPADILFDGKPAPRGGETAIAYGAHALEKVAGGDPKAAIVHLESLKKSNPRQSPVYDEAVGLIKNERLTAPQRKNVSRNYVVFDDKLISILRKDGVEVTPEERETLIRKVLQRDTRGRPLRTAPLGDTDRLVDGIRRAAGLDPQGGILEPLIEQPPSGGAPPAETLTPSGPGGPPSTQVFTDAKAFGRTKPEYKRYLELIAQRDAEDVAYRAKRAEAQAKRENSQAWADAKRELEPEIREAVVSRPEIAAWNFFEKGEAFGQKLPRRPKLDRAALTEDQFNALPADWIRDDGLHPDAIASMFGFDSGSTLVDTLASVAREAEGQKGSIVDRLVTAELDRQLNDRLGEDAKDRLDEAKDHALSLTTMEMLHEQVLALGTRLGVELPLNKGRMDWGAREILKEQRFGGLSSTKLLQEASKAARLLEKSLLGDDPQEAFKQAQYHYTVTQMAKEMLAVEKESKQFEKNAKRFRDREVSGIDAEYVNWIHDILMRIGRPVRRSVQDLQAEIAAQPNKTLADFLLSKLSDGYDIAVPDQLVDPSFRKPLEQMTVADARQAMRAIQSLKVAGREEGQVEIRGAKLDLKDQLKKVNEQLKTLGPAREPINIVWDLSRRFLAGTLQPEFLFNRLDYGDVFGLVSQWAWRPMAEAANYKAKLGKQIAKALPEIPESIKLNTSVPNVLFKDWQSGLQADGKIDWTSARPLAFTQKNLLAIMHNLGNADNAKRLAEGYGLKPQQVLDWVNAVATKDHWDYVQAFGNVFKDLKTQSDRMYRRISGVAPESIDILPIDTKFGQYDGWYHPVIHDSLFEGQYKNEKADAPFAKEYQMAMPSAGYTKSRTTYRGPLDLNLDAIANRLNQEIHDISFREAVMQANKLIGDSTFRNHLTTHYGSAYTDMLKRWVQDVANGANITSSNQAAWAKASEFFRQNIIGSLVGLNPRTVQKHTITAAINSMTEVGPANFLAEFKNIWLNPTEGKKNWDFAMEKSEELQRRHQNFMEQVSGAHEQAVNPPGQDLTSTFNYARSHALRFGTTPVAFFDLASAVPTWLAKYNVSKKLGMSEGDAIYAADTAVRNAHGSSAITSRPGFMRTEPWLASLYGFFNHVANQQYKLAWKAKEASGMGSKPADIGQLPGLALGAFSYVIAPAIIEELVTPYTNKEKESWGKKVAKTLVLGLSSSWIIVRDLARAMIDGRDPTIGLAGAGGKDLTDIVRDLSDPKTNYGMDRAHAGKTIKHSITAFGAMTGLTNAAQGNLAEYLYNLHRGVEAPPKDMKELWRGVSKGQSNPPSGPDLIERMLPGKIRKVQ